MPGFSSVNRGSGADVCGLWLDNNVSIALPTFSLFWIAHSKDVFSHLIFITMLLVVFLTHTSCLFPCRILPSICRALSWRVHPPTAYCFSKHLLFLMPYKSISLEARHDVLELSRFLTELGVIDYHFVRHKQSVVALASLLFSMQEISGVSEEALLHFEAELQKEAADLCLSKNEVLECRERFRQLYREGGYEHPETTASSAATRNEAISPVCVSYGFAAEQYLSYGDPAAPTSQYHQISQKTDGTTEASTSNTTEASTSDGPIDVTIVNGSVLGPSS